MLHDFVIFLGYAAAAAAAAALLQHQFKAKNDQKCTLEESKVH